MGADAPTHRNQTRRGSRERLTTQTTPSHPGGVLPRSALTSRPDPASLQCSAPTREEPLLRPDADTDASPRATARPAESTTDGAARPDPTPTTVPTQRDSGDSGAGRTLHLRYVAMPDTVARLDTTHPEWVLYLDTDSPAEDHCWAMLDVWRIVTLGLHAAHSATPSRPLLRLVRDDNITPGN